MQGLRATTIRGLVGLRHFKDVKFLESNSCEKVLILDLLCNSYAFIHGFLKLILVILAQLEY